MRFRRRESARPIDLNVIPLIDVVFFLLIFYVISTAFVPESAVAIDRPSSSAAQQVSGAFVPVAIVAGGGIHIGAQQVQLDDVSEAVRAALAAGGTDKAVVIPDRSVPSGLLLAVMDACSAAGAATVEVAATAEAR